MSRVFRVFVSSTFADFRAERTALRESVFPRLKDLCVAGKSRFQEVDLRWGVSQEAGLDQRAMDICLSEIERSQKASPRPNFIALIGDRYGWQPLPTQIRSEEFAALRSQIESDRDAYDGRCHAAAGMGAIDLLDTWYRLDENALASSHILVSRVPGSRLATYDPQYDAWDTEVQRPLRMILERASEAIHLPPDEHRKYWQSATHQEIERGLLSCSGAEEHVWAFFRDLSGIPTPSELVGHAVLRDFVDTFRPGPGAPLDVDVPAGEWARTLRSELSERLQGKHGDHAYTYDRPWHDGGLDENPIGTLPDSLEACEPLLQDGYVPANLCEAVFRALARTIRDEISREGAVDPVVAEAQGHGTFGEERAQGLEGRSEILGSIGDYLDGDAPSVFAIVGDGGTGKSAIIARAASMAKTRPNSVVVLRHVGATPQSTHLRGLLDSIVADVESRFGGAPGATLGGRRTAPSPTRAFRDLLERVPSHTRLCLFIDGLERLSPDDAANELTWLPRALPANVRIVVSVLEDVGSPCHRALIARQPAEGVLSIPPLEESDSRLLLDRWLANRGRRVTDAQRATILARSASEGGRPLYLRVASDEAARWHSADADPPLGASVADIIVALLARLSSQVEHGETLVQHALGYLSAARHGLSEEELLDALGHDAPVLAAVAARSPTGEPVSGLPVVLWARLHADLEPYLATRAVPGTEALGFFDSPFASIVRTRYADTAEERHRGLAHLFAGRWRRSDAEPTDAPDRTATVRFDVHAMSELPYQLAHAGDADSLAATLADPTFAAAKCAEGLPYELIADFDLLAALQPSPEATLVRSAIVQSLGAIAERPALAWQTVYNRLAPVVAHDSSVRASLIDTRRLLDSAGPWLRSTGPLPSRGDGEGIQIPFEGVGIVQSLSNGRTTMAVGNPVGEFEVRSVRDGVGLERRSLGLSHLVAVAMCEEPRRLAWMDLSGVVYNDEGSATLKGRRDEEHILYHPTAGVVAVTAEGNLVAWRPGSGEQIVVAENLPAPLADLRFCGDGDSIVFVAGFRDQRMGASTFDGAQWITRSVPYEGPTVLAADHDVEEDVIAAICQDRAVRVIDAKTGAVRAMLQYEARSRSTILGPGACIAAGSGAATGRVAFGTRQGNLAVWDWREDRLEKMADAFVRTEPENFVGMWYLPAQEEFLYTTTSGAASVAPPGAVERRAHHRSEVLAVVETAGGMVVSAGKQDKQVVWSTIEGLDRRSMIIEEGLTCLAPDAVGDNVLAGARNGGLWFQPPNRQIEPPETLKVFDGPVLGAFLQGDLVITSDANGFIMRADIREDPRRTPTGDPDSEDGPVRHPIGENLLRLLPAKDGREFWTLGRQKAGGNQYVLAVDTDGGSREVVFSCETSISDAIPSADGTLACIARDEVTIRRRAANGWSTLPPLPVEASLLSWVGGDRDLIALVGGGTTPWLELWDVHDASGPVTAAELPAVASCLSSTARRILVGCRSGDIVCYSIEPVEAAPQPGRGTR